MADTPAAPWLPDQLLFSATDIGRLYGMSPDTVRRLIREGAFGDPTTLPRRGQYARIPRAAVLAYAQAGDGAA